MIVKVGESRQDIVRSGTYNSVNVNLYVVAAAVNTAFVDADVKKQNVSIKVVLKRSGQQHIIMQDNLLLLGTYNSLKKGYAEFNKGIVKAAAAAAVKEVRLFPVTLNFGGHIRVSDGDELIVEVTPALTGLFSANVDTALSYVEFQSNPSIGYEVGIFSTISEVVQQNTNKQSFSPGDNVVRMALLNFDKTSLASEVVTNLNISSDRLDVSMSFNQLLAAELLQYDDKQRLDYSTSTPALPQSFFLFDGLKTGDELDTVKVDASFNSANVASSSNYLVSTKYVTNIEMLTDAAERSAKHGQEKIDRINEMS
ncbi:hypothetical protein [Arachidicoccus terrestris]|uniref:hypothetical protein n=1 Tax=Arachidicoccus terrestris TaxID=2875539 RepID=UPI001CC40957|nr:hypothetical protein [Arachidicoccus terrestris]UAY54795.1 hypothetical protein K9M52_15305 [Arachidicoccus terrestris]